GQQQRVQHRWSATGEASGELVPHPKAKDDGEGPGGLHDQSQEDGRRLRLPRGAADGDAEPATGAERQGGPGPRGAAAGVALRAAAGGASRAARPHPAAGLLAPHGRRPAAGVQG
ncbi:unnamed protein product, partial [Heterosigma akashiwo]